MATHKLAFGVFGWCSTERRSNRYGAFTITDAPFSDVKVADSQVDVSTIESLVGKRVKLTLVAEEIRPSEHLGDMHYKLKPSTPEKGEVIDLGVGILGLGKTSYGEYAIALSPGDGRTQLWIDPRKFYVAHDQTVTVFAEETTEDFSPRPPFKPVGGEEVTAVGDNDLQVKGIEEGATIRLHPKITRIPGTTDCFMVSSDFKAGEVVSHSHVTPEEVECHAAAMPAAKRPSRKGKAPAK